LGAVVLVVEGRVGGLLKPPAMLVREAEVVVGFVAVEPVSPVRRAVVVVGVRFTPVELVVDLVSDFGDFISEAPLDDGAGAAAGAGSATGAGSTGAEAGAGAGAGASACWTTSNPSASDMMGYVTSCNR